MKNVAIGDLGIYAAAATPADIAWQYGVSLSASDLGQFMLEPILSFSEVDGHAAWGNNWSLSTGDSYSATWDNHFQDYHIIHMETAHAVFDLYTVNDGDSSGFYQETQSGSVWGEKFHNDSFAVLTGHSLQDVPTLCTRGMELPCLMDEKKGVGESFAFNEVLETHTDSVNGGQSVNTPFGPLKTSFSATSGKSLHLLDLRVGDTVVSEIDNDQFQSSNQHWSFGGIDVNMNSYAESDVDVLQVTDPHGVSPEIAHLHMNQGLLG